MTLENIQQPLVAYILQFL